MKLEVRSTILLVLLAAPLAAQGDTKDAAQMNRLLGRGINFGNTLEAPTEGAWGVKLQPEFFERIKKAGFQSVRIPVKWSAHAQKEAPFTIDGHFFERIDWALDQARKNGLVAVLNVHHYDEMDKDPDGHAARLTALWEQIADRYRDRPLDGVLFELYNEPHDRLTDEAWNKVLLRLLAVIRKSNPERAIIIGPGQWNNPSRLEHLRLPPDDRRIIATFHYYSPFPFTHQAAGWVKDSNKWKGKKWEATADELAALRKDFDKAAAWSKRENRPLFLGEFGAYEAADMPSRALWTKTVAREAEQRGFSWAYWEFAAGFGAFDRKTNAWRQPLLDALIGQ